MFDIKERRPPLFPQHQTAELQTIRASTHSSLLASPSHLHKLPQSHFQNAFHHIHHPMLGRHAHDHRQRPQLPRLFQHKHL